MRSNLRIFTAFLMLTGMVVLFTACAVPSVVAPSPTHIMQPSATQNPVASATEENPRETSTPVQKPTAPLVLEPGDGVYTIPLHVQHKTSDEIVIMFELQNAQKGKVYWWAEGSAFQDAQYQSFDSNPARKIISITGLEPGTRYQMAVAVPEGDGAERLPTFLNEIWDPISSETLSQGGQPITVGVFGDSGFGEARTRDLANRIAMLDPDMIFHTGDLVYLAYQEGNPLVAYQHKWYSILRDLLHTTVIYPVIGNHEYDADTRVQDVPFYFYAFPMFESLQGGWAPDTGSSQREWYAVELESLQILFLNSQQLYLGTARKDQNDWLTARLNDERFKATVVVFHIPPFTSGRHSLDGVAVQSSWVPAFEAANVDLVISGHDHNYERLERNGVTYIVSGGGSSVLYQQEVRLDESIYFEAVSHYVLLEINADQIELQVFNLDGIRIDATIIPLD